MSLARVDASGARPLIDSLVGALAACDEVLPRHTPPSLTPRGDGSFWSELASLLLLIAFLLSSSEEAGDYIPKRLLASANLREALPQALRASRIRPSAADPKSQHAVLRWRELHALGELCTDLAARGCLRQPRWFRFAMQTASTCLAALDAATRTLLETADGRCVDGAQMCVWALQVLGTLAVSAPALVQHIDGSGGLQTLGDFAVASARAALATGASTSAGDGDGGRRGLETLATWEASLWVLGELVAVGTRSSRATSGPQLLSSILRRAFAD